MSDNDFKESNNNSSRKRKSTIVSHSAAKPIKKVVVLDAEDKEHDEDDVNDDVCSVCDAPGSLVCCDGCPRAYHAPCLEMTKKQLSAIKVWFCPYCASLGMGSQPSEQQPEVVVELDSPTTISTDSAATTTTDSAKKRKRALPKKKQSKNGSSSSQIVTPTSTKSPNLRRTSAGTASKDNESDNTDAEEEADQDEDEPDASDKRENGDDGDDDDNDKDCWVCEGTHPYLATCQGCPRSFHPPCLGLTKQAISKVARWHCPYCVRQGRAPEVLPINPDITLPPSIRLRLPAVQPTTPRLTTHSPLPHRSATPSTITFDPARVNFESTLPNSPPIENDHDNGDNDNPDENNTTRITARNNSRRRNNGVMGPTSALTSFLAEKGISANRIRQRYLQRMTAEANGTPQSTNSPVAATNGDSNAASSPSNPTLGRNLYVFPTLANRPAESAQATPARARLRFEYILEPAPASASKTRKTDNKKEQAKKSEKKRLKKKGKKIDDSSDSASDDDNDDSDGNVDPLTGIRMIRRRIAVCGQCDTQLPDGVMRCATCAKNAKDSQSASPISAVSKQRRTKGSEGSLLGDLKGRVRPLLEICIKFICDNIEDVSSFGDISEQARDRICRVVCRMRRLSNETIKLFIDRSSPSLRLYDCAGIDQRGFRALIPNLAHLSKLYLQGCGRLEDDVVLQIPEAIPLLNELTFDGAFLVGDHAYTLMIDRLKLPLVRFCVTNSARIGLGAVRALTRRCSTTLEILKLSRCSEISDECLSTLAAMKALKTLHLSDCVQITDDGLVPLLQNVGKELCKLRINGCTRLRNAATGRTAEPVQTLPVASNASISSVSLDTDDTENNSAEMLGRRRKRRAEDVKAVNVFGQLELGLIGQNLTKVNVGSTAFDDDALKQLVMACPGLVKLDLTRTLVGTDGVNYLLAAKCAPKLTHLWLNSLRLVTAEALQGLARTCKMLELLDVSWIFDVDDNIVSTLREHLLRLRRVYIWGCNRVTECGVASSDISKIGGSNHLVIVGSFFVI